jgi:hypothetical protein
MKLKPKVKYSNHGSLKSILISPYSFIFIYFIFRIPNTTSGLNDSFGFRQTQTAWGIREVMRHGFNFTSLQMPVLGYPFKVPFEFPIFQNLAGGFGRAFSISPTTSGRLFSLTFYCLTAASVVYLVKILSTNNHGWYAIPILFFTPFSLEWSDACLIESFTTFLLLSSFIILSKYWNSKSNYFLYVFLALSSLTALSKITIAFPVSFILFAGFSNIHQIHWRDKIFVKPLCFLILSFIPSFLWTIYSDKVKSSNFWTAWLTSKKLQSWNFGSLDQRLVMHNWTKIGARFWLMAGVLIIFAILVIFVSTLKRMQIFIFLLSIIAGPITFFNLFVVHDYYYLEVIPLLALCLGLIIPGILGYFFSNRQDRALALTVVLLVFVFFSWSFKINGSNYGKILTADRNKNPQIVREIAENTNPQDMVVVLGCDWDPSILYEADRKGLAVPSWGLDTTHELRLVLEHNPGWEISYVALCEKSETPRAPKNYQLDSVAPGLFKLNRAIKVFHPE